MSRRIAGIRKQTLRNAERHITEELKEHEEKIGRKKDPALGDSPFHELLAF